MKFCSQCGSKTEDDAIFCSKCGSKMPVMEEKASNDQQYTVPANGNPYHKTNNEYTQPKGKANKSPSKFGVVLLVVVVIGIVIGIATCIVNEDQVNHNKTPSTESKSSSNYITVSSSDDKFWFAVTAAQNLVKNELKSPSTSVFPSLGSEYSVRRSGTSYIVAGYVDAQNSFGATIRENWIATFTMGDTSGREYSVSDYSVIFS